MAATKVIPNDVTDMTDGNIGMAVIALEDPKQPLFFQTFFDSNLGIPRKFSFFPSNEGDNAVLTVGGDYSAEMAAKITRTYPVIAGVCFLSLSPCQKAK